MSQMEASAAKADNNARCLWAKLRSASFWLLSFNNCDAPRSPPRSPVAVVKNTFLTLQWNNIRRRLHRGYTGPARIESTGAILLEGCDRDLWKRSSRRRLCDDGSTSIASTYFPVSNVTDDGSSDRQESIQANITSSVSELNVIDEVCCCSPLAKINMYESETSVEAATQETTMGKARTNALVKGESEVNYDDNEIEFQWSVDLRTAHTSHRCGFQRRFNMRIKGQDVPFVFHIDPVAKERVSIDRSLVTTDKPWAKKRNDKSTFRRPGTYAHLWLRCADTDMLPSGNCCMRVSISGGGDMHRISEGHDFMDHPNCNQVVPDTAETLWQIPFDIDKHGSWLVSGFFQLVQPAETDAECESENADLHASLTKKQLPTVPCSVIDVAEAFTVKNTFLCLKGQKDDQPPLIRGHSAPTNS